MEAQVATRPKGTGTDSVPIRTPSAEKSGDCAKGNNRDCPLVLVVDDDERVRCAVQELLLSVGLDAVTFASAREVMGQQIPDRPGCLITDVRMPGSSGLDLQQHLVASGNKKPIIFLTGHADIPMTVQAMKAGAVDFLTKPFRDQTLLDAVLAGIDIDRAQRAKSQIVESNVKRLETLTPREREVLREVARGRVNKQIAYDLGISEVTVKLHRGNVMRKMEAKSIGELIRAWQSLPPVARETNRAAVALYT
jgi:FixJ family two-component response regulator